MHDALRRTRLQLAAVGEAGRAKELLEGDVETLARKVTELAAAATGCERVNVWLFDERETTLRCIDLYEASSATHSEGAILRENEYENEFRALKNATYVDASDALTDPRTAGYVEAYLKPLRITSMLDTVIQISGKNMGLLCFEHVDRTHLWQADEISFAAQLADKLALAIISRTRRRAEDELRASEARFRTIDSAVSDAVLALDLQTGAVVHANRSAMEMFGVAHEEILTFDFGGLSVGTPPCSRAEATRLMAEAADGDTHTFDWHFRARDRETFWGEVSLRRAAFGDTDVLLLTLRDITERRKRDEALRFANVLLTSEIESAPDGVLAIEVHPPRVSYNRKFLKIWGFAPDAACLQGSETILAAVMAQLTHPERLRAQVLRARLHPEEAPTSEVAELKDGRFIEYHIGAIKAAPGVYLGRINFFRDVSERKRAERELLFANTLHTTAMETSLDAILAVDAEGKIVSYNRRFVEMWHLPQTLVEAGVDEPLLRAVAAQIQDPDAFRSRVRDLYDHPGEQVEDELVTKDGRIIDRFSAALNTQEGKCLGRIWFFRDVTEKRQAEARLRASEERFRAVSETAQDGIVILDSADRALYWNHAAERIFGYVSEEAMGKDVREWLGRSRDHDQPRASRRLLESIGAGGVLGKTVELTARRKDGVEIPIELSLARMRLGEQWGAVGIVRDIRDRKRAEEQIRRMARHDALTGLPNRLVFIERMEHAIAGARRRDKRFAVLYLDLDHFKGVNDTLGHPVGDALLQAVAKRLRESIRSTDTAARFGGDEFAVIVSDLRDPSDAASLADKIVKAVAEPFQLFGNEVRSSTTIGIAVHGADSPDAETLLSHADIALYRAKSAGRGTYRFFTEAMDAEVRARVALAAELRVAIDTAQMFLAYQPQIDLDTGQISGVEALVRWQHPRRGVLSRADMIAVAEECGLVTALGHWALREACGQMRAWLDAGIAPPVIGVSLSGLQLKQPQRLESELLAALTETGVPPQRIELEVSESVLTEVLREREEALGSLRKAGLGMAVEGFGAGYSSLSELRHFPVDRVKIARELIAGLTPKSENAAVMKAAISLLNELGLVPLVEGVDTIEQLTLVRSWGARQAQGDHIGEALAAPEMTALLRSGDLLGAGPRDGGK